MFLYIHLDFFANQLKSCHFSWLFLDLVALPRAMFMKFPSQEKNLDTNTSLWMQNFESAISQPIVMLFVRTKAHFNSHWPKNGSIANSYSLICIPDLL